MCFYEVNFRGAGSQRCDKLTEIQKVTSNVYRVKLSIPIPALKTINSYIIEFNNELLLIDTGMPIKQNITSIINAINSLGFKVSDLKHIVATHLHIDHIGAAFKLKEFSNANVYLHKGEKEFINKLSSSFNKDEDLFTRLFKHLNTPKDIIEVIRRDFYAYRYLYAYTALSINREVMDQEKIYDNLIVIETPGHSPHHICLYYPSKRILFTGDHILPTITPNIRAPLNSSDPLWEYIQSLNKILKLNVDFYLPGHGELSKRLSERIRELKIHHLNRLTEIMEIINGDYKSVFEVASRVNWDVKIPWSEFPPIQIFFALTETYAHIVYLLKRGFADIKLKNDIFLFKAKNSVNRLINFVTIEWGL